MDEIKVSKVAGNLPPAKSQQPVVKQDIKHAQTEAVTVTNHMSKLVNLLGADEASSDENARVSAVKKLIDSDQYVVDFNALSEKLLSSGLLGKGV